MADKRGRENQRAAAARRHGRQLVLGRQEGAREIGIDRRPPVFQGNFLRGPHGPQGARIIKSDIEATKALQRQRHGPLRTRRVAHIAHASHGLRAAVRQLRHQRIEFRPPPRHQHQPRAMAGKQPRRRMTDARAGARDDGDLVVQLLHGISLQVNEGTR
ncbi:hypothetical protein D3C72_1658200 [compost metagenome]